MTDTPQQPVPFIGQIPQSQALAEAEAMSLAELFGHDPERLSDAQLDRLIGVLRAQAVRWAEGEAQRQAKGKPKEMKTAAKAQDLFG